MQTAVVLAGTLAVVMAALLAYAAVGRSRFDRRVEHSIRQLERAPVRVGETPIRASDLADLPAPIARYLEFAGVVGKRPIARAHVTQSGEFRLDPDGHWMSMVATQHYTANPPRFVWDATIDVISGIPFRVRDGYTEADSQMLGTLAGAIPVVDAAGPEIEQGSYMRFLGEGAWLPTVFLEDYIAWDPIDVDRARLVSTRGDIDVSAVCHVDEQGALRRFEGPRYFERGGTYRMETWYGRYDEYTEVDGFRVPTRCVAAWDLADGSFDYVRVSTQRFDFEGRDSRS
ncbi:MAG: DUF6544 family protein [Bradymonadaceae bacterium]